MTSTKSKPLRAAVLAVAVLVLLFGFFIATRPKPLLTFNLADGTEVAVASLEYGKEFHIYNGTSLQQSFFRIAGTKVSPRIVGTESVIPATQTNGTGNSLGLVLRRFAPASFVSAAWNGHQQVTVSDGKREVAGFQRMVTFDSELVNETTKVTGEQILWEFPYVTNRDLHFRLYDTNATTKAVSTNDFILNNPAAGR